MSKRMTEAECEQADRETALWGKINRVVHGPIPAGITIHQLRALLDMAEAADRNDLDDARAALDRYE